MTRVRIERLELSELHIPFKTSFRHASAERSETSGIWVEATARGRTGYGESCPRPYVTAESIESARAFFEEHQASIGREISDLDSLRAWMAANEPAIDRNPAAWCAVELALLDLMARTAGRTVESLLSVPAIAGPFRYTAVLGDAGEAAYAATAQGYKRVGFTDFKVKLSGDRERDRKKLAVLRDLALPTLRVRVDANNLWPDVDVAIAYLRDFDHALFGVEEPIGAGRYQDLGRLAEALDCRAILDESFVSVAQLAQLDGPADRWAINVRVSKMGGILRSLGVASAASARGIPIIVGAQVGETSLLTRAALTIAQAAGAGVLAQEGAFGTFLLERDVCDPPLMFGAGGVLDPGAYPGLAGEGFGLRIVK